MLIERFGGFASSIKSKGEPVVGTSIGTIAVIRCEGGTQLEMTAVYFGVGSRKVKSRSPGS